MIGGVSDVQILVGRVFVNPGHHDRDGGAEANDDLEGQSIDRTAEEVAARRGASEKFEELAHRVTGRKN